MGKKSWVIVLSVLILLIALSLVYSVANRANRPDTYKQQSLGHGGDDVATQYQGSTQSLDNVLKDLLDQDSKIPGASAPAPVTTGTTTTTQTQPSAGPSTPYGCNMNGASWTAHTQLSAAGQYICYEDRTMISGDAYYCTAMWDTTAQSWKYATVYKYDNHREWWAVAGATGHYAGPAYTAYTSCTPQ